MVVDTNKKAKITKNEEEEDGSEQSDPALLVSIENLQEVQDELEDLEDKLNDEVLELEKKYNEIRKPIYGNVIFFGHPMLRELLNEEDLKIFKHLESLEVCDAKDVKSGYSITFNFRTNPYFENSKLTKTFSFENEASTKITGTNILWKDGRDVSNGHNGDIIGSKRSWIDESFFSWFESQVSDIPSTIQDEVAEFIREELWINPLKYFLNELSENESDEEDDENSGDNNDDSNEDGEDEEDSEEEEK